GLSITKADSYTLTVTDGSLTSATTGSFSVNPAAAHHVAFSTPPVSATVGGLADVIVSVQDQYNNIVTSNTSNVTLTLNTTTAVLVGTTTVAAVSGVATFDDLILTTSGTYALAATDGVL